MRWSCFLAVAALLFPFVPNAMQSAGGGETEGAEPQRWALLIGVNDYAELEDLRYCSRDITALAEKLKAVGFPEDHIFLLSSDSRDAADHPGKSNIEKHLELVTGLAEEDDLVMVVFSGHGIHADGVSYLCPAEASAENPKGTMVSLDLVYEKLRGTRAALKLLVADACRNDPRPSGRKSADVLGDAKELARRFERPPDGVVVLASCAERQVSWEDRDLEHGVFTHFLLRGLDGEADGNRNGRVSLGELYEFTSAATKRHVATRWRDFQSPQLFGSLNGVFEFDRPTVVAEVKETEHRFTGTWRGTSECIFYFDMKLKVKGTEVAGEILWTLASAPVGTLLARRVGDRGTETVVGTYDAVNRRFELRGTRVSDETLLATDQYRLLVSPDGESIHGNTRGNDADWASTISGARAK